MKVVINIGHGKRADGGFDPGAIAPNGTTEHQFNVMVARALQAKHTGLVIVDFPAWGYELFNNLNRVAKPEDAILSLHCNGANDPTATGSEVYYWHTSAKGKELAEELLDELAFALDLRKRGVKPIATPNQRGYGLFKGTLATALIAEPFFISSPHDFAVGTAKFDDLVTAYSNFIQYVEKL